MKTTLRWCKKCGQETLHDIVADESDPDNGFERVFMGIVTVGFSEIARETYWKCQRCDHMTRKR